MIISKKITNASARLRVEEAADTVTATDTVISTEDRITLKNTTHNTL